MSHFVVLVVGENPEEQLAPYHEFECTGDDNEFIQEVDQTEEALAEYRREGNTTTMYKDPDGNLHSPYTDVGGYDNKFWREMTPEEVAKFGKKGFYQDWNTEEHGVRLYSTDWKDGLEYHTKVFAFPSEGWSEVEVPESSQKSFAEFCGDEYGHSIVPFGTEPDLEDEHKYGYTLVDEAGEVIKTIDRTNPNAKWDWYSVGGRWNGYFKLKSGTLGLLGEPGLQTMNKDYKPPKRDRADQCIKGDIDVDGMRDEAGEDAAKTYDLVQSVIGDQPLHLTWKQVQERNQTGKIGKDGEPEVNWNAAREEYNAQPAVIALRKNEDTLWFEADNFLVTREEYIERARNGALCTFAIVKDGKWFERGEMGWWGIVRDEKERDQWNMQFSLLIDNLPDETLLTVVDCHI